MVFRPSGIIFVLTYIDYSGSLLYMQCLRAYVVSMSAAPSQRKSNVSISSPTHSYSMHANLTYLLLAVAAPALIPYIVSSALKGQ